MYFKSFKTLFQEMGDALVADGSQATDRRMGALTAALLTACSSALSMGWLGLAELYNMFYTNSSTGVALRRRVRDLGMTINPGDFAVGSVMVTPLDVTLTGTLPVGTLLQSSSGLLYQVQATVAIARPYAVVSVQATSTGTVGNLPAGTLLTPVNAGLTGLVFKVGSGFDSNSLPVGDLTFGLDPETDAEIKARFPDYLVGLSRCTLPAVRQALLDTAGVYNLVLQNAVPVPGYVTISVTSLAGDDLSVSLKNSIAATMDGFAAAGIGYRLKAVQKRLVNVQLQVTCTDTNIAPAVLQLQISNAVKALTQSLEPGRSIYNEDIIKAGYLDSLSFFKVLSGEAIAATGEILVIGTVTTTVTYG